MKKRAMVLVLTFLALLVLPHLWTAARLKGFDHWSKASWASAGIASDPEETPGSRHSGLRCTRLGVERGVCRPYLDFAETCWCYWI